MSWKHRKRLGAAEAALEKNDYETADGLLTEILDNDSDFVEMLFHRALVRLRLDRSEEALRDAEEGVRRRPENSVAHMILGEVYVAQCRYLDAFQALKKSVELEADNGRAYFFLAKTCIGLGRKEDAANYLQQALEFERDFVTAQIAVHQL